MEVTLKNNNSPHTLYCGVVSEEGESFEIHRHDHSGDYVINLDMPDNWRATPLGGEIKIGGASYVFWGTSNGKPIVRRIAPTQL